VDGRVERSTANFTATWYQKIQKRDAAGAGPETMHGALASSARETQNREKIHRYIEICLSFRQFSAKIWHMVYFLLVENRSHDLSKGRTGQSVTRQCSRWVDPGRGWHYNNYTKLKKKYFFYKINIEILFQCFEITSEYMQINK